MEFTNSEKVAALRKEIAMRKSVYPKMVAASKMTTAEMIYGINIMEAIVDDYTGGERTLELFAEEQ